VIEVALGPLIGFVKGQSVGEAVYFSFVTGPTMVWRYRAASVVGGESPSVRKTALFTRSRHKPAPFLPRSNGDMWG
jgi:hypothetical protein